MARAIYPYELADSDIRWLLENYLDTNPDTILLDLEQLPVVLLPVNNSWQSSAKEENAELNQLEK